MGHFCALALYVELASDSYPGAFLLPCRCGRCEELLWVACARMSCCEQIISVVAPEQSAAFSAALCRLQEQGACLMRPAQVNEFPGKYRLWIHCPGLLESQLTEYFSHFGNVVDLYIPRDR